MCSYSMADVLTLGQQQITVLHYQVQQRSVALVSNNLFQIWTTNTSFYSETGQRKFVITPELALPIWYEYPLALCYNLYSGYSLDQWIFWLGGVYNSF